MPKPEFNRPEITTPTRGNFEGAPTLALPTGNPRFPIQFTIKKWRIIAAHFESDVLPFLKDNNEWEAEPKTGRKPARSSSTVDLSKLDPATAAAVQAALSGGKAVAPAPTAPAPAATTTTLDAKVAALRARMGK